MTNQRQMILEVVQEDHTHLTADEIYERVRKKLPRISMGTVYRNLDILNSCGFIKKLEPGHPQMRFDGNTREHYHVTCTQCGRVHDACIEPTDNTLENLENALGKLTRYGIFGHKLEFMGLCPACMEEASDLSEEEQQQNMD
jgi:Fur family ferric uptake transcriptional regulator